MKSARERMDIISAYREVGSYRGAAALSGTTAKTVKRVIARHESGGVAPARQPRARNYDSVTELVSERVETTKGRIAAKRWLPTARAAQLPAAGLGAEGVVASGQSPWSAAGGVVTG